MPADQDPTTPQPSDDQPQQQPDSTPQQPARQRPRRRGARPGPAQQQPQQQPQPDSPAPGAGQLDQQPDVGPARLLLPDRQIGVLGDGTPVMGTYDYDGTPYTAYVQTAKGHMYAGRHGDFSGAWAGVELDLSADQVVALRALFASDLFGRLGAAAGSWVPGAAGATPTPPADPAQRPDAGQLDQAAPEAGQPQPRPPFRLPEPVELHRFDDGVQIMGLLDTDGSPFLVDVVMPDGSVSIDETGRFSVYFGNRVIDLTRSECQTLRNMLNGPDLPLGDLLAGIWIRTEKAEPEQMRAAVVERLRGLVDHILRQKQQQRPAAPRRLTDEEIAQHDQQHAAEFAALQQRLSALDRWPSVTIEPYIGDDDVDPSTLGRHISDDYQAGGAYLSFDLPQEGHTPTRRPWVDQIGGLGVDLHLENLLPHLPGILALLADPRARALLERDGWTIPPVLGPVLALIAQQQTSEGAGR